MKTELITSRITIGKLLPKAASAPLRVFLAISLSARDGLATVSAIELARLAGLTERSVFSALAHLERAGYIAREYQGPGPFANAIRLPSLAGEKSAPPAPAAGLPGLLFEPQAAEASPASIAAECEQNAAAGMEQRIASTFRPLNPSEQTDFAIFVAHRFGNELQIVNETLVRLSKDGGVSDDAGLPFFMAAVQTYARRHTWWASDAVPCGIGNDSVRST